MTDLLRLVPDGETVKSMSTENLAWAVLQVLQERALRDRGLRRNGLQPPTFIGSQFQQFDYGPGYKPDDETKLALSEAFAFLVNEGLIVPTAEASGYGNGLIVLSRKGVGLDAADKFQSYIEKGRFPPELLHPEVRRLSWGDFVKDDDASRNKAVRDSFIELEVLVRTTAGLAETLRGADLMQAAFNHRNGPLRDADAQPGEQVARANLFAGAMGAYRNPVSHRRVALSAKEAYRQLVLASSLFEIVQERAAAGHTPPA